MAEWVKDISFDWTWMAEWAVSFTSDHQSCITHVSLNLLVTLILYSCAHIVHDEVFNFYNLLTFNFYMLFYTSIFLVLLPICL